MNREWRHRPLLRSSHAAAALAGLFAYVALAVPASADVLLRDVAVQSGVVAEIVCGSMEAKRFILEENGSGAALFDYDGDGDLDLYLVNGSTLEALAAASSSGAESPHRNVLYRNDGVRADGSWSFVDVSAAAGVDHDGWGTGVAAGDLDGDGDEDLYIAGYGENVLYENLGDGTFRDATETSGTSDRGWGHSIALLDYDGDGDLDLYVANNLEFSLERLPNGGRPCSYRGLETACGPVGFPAQADRLFRNDGDLRFTDISEVSGIAMPEPRFGLGVVAGDVDDDGAVDLVVANDSGPNFLFHNRGDGTFEEIGLLAGVATQAEGRVQAGMGIDLGDLDDDGDLDLFVTNFSFDHDALYRNQGSLYFTDDSYPSGLGNAGYVPMSWGTRFLDLDLDGRLDLYIANGHLYPEVDAGKEETFAQPDQAFLGVGGGRFQEKKDALAGGDGVGRGLAAGDLDFDGDWDLVVVQMDAPPALLKNSAASEATRETLQVYARGGEGARVRAEIVDGTDDGDGAVREIRREIRRSGSYASSSEGVAHFTYSPAETLRVLEVRTTDGQVRRFVGLRQAPRVLLPD